MTLPQGAHSHMANSALQCQFTSVCVCVLFAPGHDLESLLFNFLDEFLFNFSADPFFVAKVSYYFTYLPCIQFSYSESEDYRI